MKKIKLTALLIALFLFLLGCSATPNEHEEKTGSESENTAIEGTEAKDDESAGTESDKKPNTTDKPSASKESSETDAPHEELGIYDGYFEGGNADLHVECLSGTRGAYKLEGETLTFTAIDQESIYMISGNFRGHIVIDVGDTCKFELEFRGFSMISDSANPITVLSGEEVALKAKKEYANYIYDDRAALLPTDISSYDAAIHSEVDLEIGGKGNLTVFSKNNKGIHTKDDLQVKNLSLIVVCKDNALKGNDSVSLTGGAVTLVATDGDCIKTENTDMSSKGKQRGSVSILGGVHSLYAASDGIDAAYSFTLDDETTKLTIDTVHYARTSKDTTESELSSKKTNEGIRAGNVILINNGTLNIKSDGDALHASKQTVLENGASAVGNLTVNGGVLTLESAQNGLYAEGVLKIVNGEINVIGAQNGISSAFIDVYRGKVSISAKENGIYAFSDIGDALKIRGGTVYISCEGKGLCSDSQNEMGGILLSGGHTVIFSLSASAITAIQGYAYEGGACLAVMPQEEAAWVETDPTFVNIGTSMKMTLSKGEFLTAKIGENRVTVRVPFTLEAAVLAFGDCLAEFELSQTCTDVLDPDGVLWQ